MMKNEPSMNAMSNDDQIRDVIIIGAGPAGLACAAEAQRHHLSCLVIDKGGICDNIRRFPTKMTFYSTPELLEIAEVPFTCSSPRPHRNDVLEYYHRVALRRSIPLLLHTRVEAIQRRPDGIFDVHCSSAKRQSRAIILATGYFDTTNKLNVPGEELPHVHPYYTEAFAYAGSRVLVIGGRNSAVETALDLWRHGAHVQLVHRGPSIAESVKYWQRPDIENRIKAGDIMAHFNSRVRRIDRECVEIEHVESGAVSMVGIDFVIPHIGYRPDENLLRRCGVRYDAETLVADINKNTFESSVGNLYLAGSVLCGAKVWNIFIENGREHAKPIIADIKTKMLA